MNRNRNGKTREKSRRDFAKIVGFGVAAAALGPGATARPRPDALDVDVLVKLAAEGSAVRWSEPELADLKKEIQESGKGLAKVRDFRLPADVEPAFIFRAK
jgi:hypothetical protein